jgi:hypothetical protein
MNKKADQMIGFFIKVYLIEHSVEPWMQDFDQLELLVVEQVLIAAQALMEELSALQH